MMLVSSYISIMLNANGLNLPIKRHRVADGLKKTRPTQVYASYKRLTSAHIGSSGRMKNYIPCKLK